MMATRVPRVVLPVLLGLAWVATLVAPSGSAQAEPGPYTVDFDTSGSYTWQVPAGVTLIEVTVSGAQGGPLAGAPLLGLGGKGATVAGQVPVTPGETLDVVVGGAGGQSTGGFGGGGDGGVNSTNAALSGGGGGGASSIAHAASGTPMVVAGGGGGGAQLLVVGGPSGTIGGGTGTLGTGGPGGPGTTGADGLGGTAGSWASLPVCVTGANGTAGAAGEAGQGGAGAGTTGLLSFGGGGGGGGYTGGGGGGTGATCVGGVVGTSSGGGGGGASYAESAATGTTITEGAVLGDGGVTIQYDDTVAPVATPVLAHGPETNGWWRSASVSVTWNWTDELSGVDDSACTTSSSVTDQGVTTELASCADQEGNVGHASVQVRIDRTKPVVRLKRPKGAMYHRGARVVAKYSCRDALSGVVSCRGTTRSGKVLNTRTLGKHHFIVKAVDRAGNKTSVKVTYHVVK